MAKNVIFWGINLPFSPKTSDAYSVSRKPSERPGALYGWMDSLPIQIIFGKDESPLILKISFYVT